MLLTITCTGENSANLSYLLHKNPARPQTTVLSFGKAHVFYPELRPERCTAALLLDIDPLDLSRGKPGSQAGSDVSLSALDRAAERLKVNSPLEALGKKAGGEKQKNRPILFQGSVCYRDKRFKDYDAAVIMELIEHLDESRLPCFSSVIFGDTAPKTVIITTPNIEYNINYLLDSKKETLSGQKRFRHPDHRFEWNRAQFRSWAEAAASRYGYSLRIEEIGQRDEERGTPTQMGVFSKRTGLAVDGGTK